MNMNTDWNAIVAKAKALQKQAFSPLPQDMPQPQPGAPMDPSMMGGAPMDPSMMGGMMPQGDPSMMGGMPQGGAPMDPSMMGGMPQEDPVAMIMQQFQEMAAALDQVMQQVDALTQLQQVIQQLEGTINEDAQQTQQMFAEFNERLSGVESALMEPAAPPTNN